MFQVRWSIAVGFLAMGAVSAAAFPIPGLRDYEGGDEHPERRVRLLPAEKSFFPFVDRFGQYAHTSWPGKVGSDAELRQRAADEARDFAERPESAIPDADRFGGWAGGPQLEATGMFRTEKVGGRWYFVDPDGRLFFSLGVNCVQFSSWTGVTGREKFFCDLPARDDGLFANCWGRQKGPSVRGFYHDRFPYETFDFCRANLIRKYGPDDWLQKASALAVRRMRSWGLNTIGNWSSFGLVEQDRIPYTDAFSTRARPIGGNRGFWRKFPDVFAPEFQDNVEADARKTAARSGADPWCLGWFVDNELDWGKGEGELAAAIAGAKPAFSAFTSTMTFVSST